MWLFLGGERSCVIDVTVLKWVAYVVRGLTAFGFVTLRSRLTWADSVAYLSQGVRD